MRKIEFCITLHIRTDTQKMSDSKTDVIRCQCPYGDGGLNTGLERECAHPKGKCAQHITVSKERVNDGILNMCPYCHNMYNPENTIWD